MQKLDTSAGLSSIASLSLGLSMSMSGGGGMFRNMAPSGSGGSSNSLTAGDGSSAPSSRPTSRTPSRRQSFADLFPVAPVASPSGVKAVRRTSTAIADLMAQSSGSSSPNSKSPRRASVALTKITDKFHALQNLAKPERSPGPLVKSMGKVSMERVVEEGGSEQVNSNSEDEDETSPLSISLPTGSARKPGYPRANGNAVPTTKGRFLTRSLDAIVKVRGDTSPSKQVTFNLSSEDIRSSPPTSRSPSLQHRQKAAVAIEIPNGPVALATASSGHGDGGSDAGENVRWFRRKPGSSGNSPTSRRWSADGSNSSPVIHVSGNQLSPIQSSMSDSDSSLPENCDNRPGVEGGGGGQNGGGSGNNNLEKTKTQDSAVPAALTNHIDVSLYSTSFFGFHLQCTSVFLNASC